MSELVPVKIHIKEQPGMWKRFKVRWTPTILVMSDKGDEARRVEGYLPADELLPELEMGLGFIHVNRKEWNEAERAFREVVDRWPNSAAAPEALYWAGVSRYSSSHQGEALQELGREFRKRYSNTVWAKRASIWGG